MCVWTGVRGGEGEKGGKKGGSGKKNWGKVQRCAGAACLRVPTKSTGRVGNTHLVFAGFAAPLGILGVMQ